MAIQVVHGGKFIKTEEKKEMHDVPEKLEMYVNLAPMSYITCHISTSYWVH